MAENWHAIILLHFLLVQHLCFAQANLPFACLILDGLIDFQGPLLTGGIVANSPWGSSRLLLLWHD